MIGLLCGYCLLFYVNNVCFIFVSYDVVIDVQMVRVFPRNV